MPPYLDTVEVLSLVLITAIFLAFLGLLLKAKVHRGLSLDLFIFALVLFSAEVPHILSTIGLPSTEQFETVGLALHTVSMGIVCVAVTYRTYRSMKRFGGKQGG